MVIILVNEKDITISASFSLISSLYSIHRNDEKMNDQEGAGTTCDTDGGGGCRGRDCKIYIKN